MKNLMTSIVVLGVSFAFGDRVAGETIQTEGEGAAVTSIDRSATFDTLTIDRDIPLSDYTEGGLFIGMNGDSWTKTAPAEFDPFGGANPDRAFYATYDGATGWTVIRTTDSRKIFGIEFLYGNAWTTGDIYVHPWGNSNAWVEWQTLDGATVVSSGQIGPPLQVGTVIGFRDASGFDELWLKCQIANQADPNLQALAMDNLHVQITSVPVYTIQTSASPANGGSTTGDGTYPGGSSVTVLATPAAGFEFVDWTENGSTVCTTAGYDFTALADRTLVAKFATIPGGLMIPGDANRDGLLDISDSVATLGFLFLGSPAMLPCGGGNAADPANVALLDWQPDGAVDISDAVSMLSFLFLGGQAHAIAVPGAEMTGCVRIIDCSDRCGN